MSVHLKDKATDQGDKSWGEQYTINILLNSIMEERAFKGQLH